MIDKDDVITAGDGCFSVRLTVGQYMEWARLALAGEWEAADAYLARLLYKPDLSAER